MDDGIWDTSGDASNFVRRRRTVGTVLNQVSARLERSGPSESLRHKMPISESMISFTFLTS